MTEQELTQIRSYLLDKKLPIDILVEVYDHFITQISGLQKEENLKFEEAFEKVKKSWQDELTLYWDGSWDLHDNSKFLRKMSFQINLGVLKETLKMGTAMVLLLVILAQLADAAVFKYVLTGLIVALTFFPLVHYLYRRQDFNLAKKYDNYVLTYYQHSAALFFSTFAILLPNLMKIYDHSDAVLSVFRLNTVPLQIKRPLFFWSVFVVIILGNLMVFVIQRNYLRQIHKVKPFLKFLKPAA